MISLVMKELPEEDALPLLHMKLFYYLRQKLIDIIDFWFLLHTKKPFSKTFQVFWKRLFIFLLLYLQNKLQFLNMTILSF